MVIDNEQAIAEAMGGWDIHMASNVTGKVQEGVGWFRARSGVAGCKNGMLVEQTWNKHWLHSRLTLGWLGDRGYVGHA
jgi:hypothetical protein